MTGRMKKPSAGPGARVLILIVTLVSAVTVWVAAHRLKEASEGERREAMRALAETMGFATLAVSSDCTLGRSLTEGLAGCLGDVAGGYCTFASCDIVARPDLQTDYDSRMKIVKVGE